MRYCPVCRAAFRTLRFCPRDSCPTVEEIDDPLVGSTLGARYRILDVIASGGMGRVYRASHARIAALFAVKVLYGEMSQDDSLRSRFQREAEVASCMQSRHILRVFDFGESDEGLLYLAMEYLDGMSLSTRIVRDGALPPGKAVALALQVARGLAHAHERGVVHRDLKSENVLLVTEDDEEDVVKLLDFGVARTQDAAKLTQVGQIVGTPHYMAPEQFTGQPVDARADLYALGVLMFEMLTGELPFRGTSMIAMATQHATQPPGSVRARNPAVAQSLEAIVQRLLAKQPDDRFPSARALLDALRAEAAPPDGPEAVEIARAARWMGDSKSQRERRATEAAVPAPVLAPETLVERIRRAIQLGAPTYNSGDHLACYTLYRDTATELARGAAEAGGLAVAARLRVALQRAAAMEPTQAAWEMRHAFDDLLGAAGAGGLALDGREPQLAREIAGARAISERRYAAGDFDIVGDYYLELARQLSARARVDPAIAQVQRRLDEAVAAGEQAGGGQRALAELAAELDALMAGSDGSTTDIDMPRAPAGMNACPKLPELQQRAVEAIAGGAPTYNAGDPLACYRIFRRATQEILGAVDGSGVACAPVAALMRSALEQANAVPVERGVWILRHALDELLAAR